MNSRSWGSWRTIGTRTLAEFSARAGRWWIREFLNLFPQRVAKWLAGPGRGTLVLANKDEIRVLEFLDEGRRVLASTHVRACDYSLASIEQFLRTQSFQRDDVDIGIRLASEKIFRRKLTLPTQAVGSVADIIAQDLTRKTPFRLQDVYHGHSAAKEDSTGKIVVWQWLVRQEFVDDARTPFGLDIEDVAFVDAAAGDDAEIPAPFIALRPGAKARNSWIKKSVLALGCSAVLLALAAGTLRYERQQAAIYANDGLIAIARVKAQKVRSEFDKIEKRQSALLRLRSQKSELPGLLDVWEETTRVLPAHSWLTELRLTEAPEKNIRWVAMTGFSAAATDFVRLIDQSQLLTDASLTAPVALDPVEARERFAIQAKIKSSLETVMDAMR
jgi:general secretion pathway protein L